MLLPEGEHDASEKSAGQTKSFFQSASNVDIRHATLNMIDGDQRIINNIPYSSDTGTKIPTTFYAYNNFRIIQNIGMFWTGFRPSTSS
jgi:hypothetical protein